MAIAWKQGLDYAFFEKWVFLYIIFDFNLFRTDQCVCGSKIKFYFQRRVILTRTYGCNLDGVTSDLCHSHRLILQWKNILHTIYLYIIYNIQIHIIYIIYIHNIYIDIYVSYLEISYLEILKVKGESQKNNWSILRLIFKRPLIWVSCICCLGFTNTYLKFQVGQWFRTVVLLRKKFLSF